MNNLTNHLNADAQSLAQLVAQMGQHLSSAFECYQEIHKRVNLESSPAQPQITIPTPDNTKIPTLIITANGHTISEDKATSISEDDFGVILDVSHKSLRFRVNPHDQSPLTEADIEDIGSRRIEVLKYMLKHPTRNVSIDNVSSLPKQPENMEPNTLAKTISLLRKALGGGGQKNPYITTEEAWGQRCRYAYLMNPNWHYLVIEKKS